MLDESRQRRRKPIRIAGFDYSSEGGYFVTIVTHQRLPVFGMIRDNKG